MSMEEWKEYKFVLKPVSSLGRIVTGKTPRTSVSENYGGEIPFLTPSDDLSGKYAPTTNKTITNLGLSEVKNCLLPAGSICVSCIGSDLGKVVVTREPTVTNQQFNSIIPNSDNDVDFIYYLMTKVGKQLNYLSKTSTAVPIINKSTFSSHEVNVPSISTQRRIASILSSLDDKIEVNRRINENLEAQAQALFKSWFVDFEPFRDGEFVESELGRIPKGWRVGTLGEICKQSSTKVGNRNDVKVLSPVTSGNLMLSEEYFTKQVFSESIAKYKIVQKGAFAYNPARVNIGSLGRNEYEFDGAVSPVYVVFECKDGYSNYFDLYRTTERFKTEVLLRAIGGVRQSLNYVDFAMIQSIIAPQDVVDAFNPLFERLKTMQKHLALENDRLAALRDTLLPKLMSGEIRIN